MKCFLQPGLMTVSAVMSVYVLEGITKTAKVFVSEKSEESFLSFCHGFSSGQVNKEAPPEPEMCFSDFWDDRFRKIKKSMLLRGRFPVLIS